MPWAVDQTFAGTIPLRGKPHICKLSRPLGRTGGAPRTWTFLAISQGLKLVARVENRPGCVTARHPCRQEAVDVSRREKGGKTKSR